MYCKNCHTEWLDRTAYRLSNFNSDDQITVTVAKGRESTFDPCNSAAFNISTEEPIILTRRVPTVERISDFFRFLMMSIPQRTIIARHSDMDTLKPGDHVMWHRPWAVWHHQLIKRRTGHLTYDIIHFYTRDDAEMNKLFEVEILEKKDCNFAEEHGTLYKINYSRTIQRENPERLTFDRANAKLHERGYRLFTHNCEHVISFCKTGRLVSYQVGWLKKEIAFFVMRAVIIIVVICGASFADDQMTSNETITEPQRGINFMQIPYISSPRPSAASSTMTSNTAGMVTTPAGHPRRGGKSELVEGLSITGFEVFMFVFVIWRHYKAYKCNGIDGVDFTRRCGEAFLEMVSTLIFFYVHMIFVFCVYPHVSLSGDIGLALLLTLPGKMIGLFLGQYLCQKIIKEYFESSFRKSGKSDCLIDSTTVSYRSIEASVSVETV